MHTSAFLGAPRIEELQKVLPESYLESAGAGLGIANSKIPALMGLAQFTEIASMIILPLAIKKFGFKSTILFGMILLPVRFGIFGFIPHAWAAIPSLTMHGVTFTCVVISGFMLTERLASPEIRSSAQALTTLGILGVGKLIGTQVAGLAHRFYTHDLPVKLSIAGTGEVSKITDWQTLFMIPCAIGILSALLFGLFFPNDLSRNALKKSPN